MIFGNVHSKEDISIYPQAFQKAIQYLKETDFVNMECGAYHIDGDDMIAHVFETTTVQRETKRPEVHAECIDIHFVVKGCEKDCYFMDMGDNVIDEDKFEELDVGFFKPNPKMLESSAVLQEGCYAAFFPADAHVPACSVKEDIPIKKVLIKLKVSAL